jgi:hypothetical protein
MPNIPEIKKQAAASMCYGADSALSDPCGECDGCLFRINVPALVTALEEAQGRFADGTGTCYCDTVGETPCAYCQIATLEGKLDAVEKQVMGQKGTLHKVKGKWDTSKREGERLAAALAHLLAWVQPSASQQVEAEIETAIEELEQYRKAHPRLARILKGE